ncbi:MAG: chorismate mutase, partial [Candidatus Caenarcaniphilales bacterium]|nr:chorismate mutase [Candidatus Caenarcaniphilales bacterium]
MKFIKAIRLATTINQDSPAEIRLAVKELLEAMLEDNNLKVEDIISVYFTLTPDVKSLNPATAVREQLQWNSVPMICAQEAFIEGGMQKCIRGLIHASFEEDKKVHHIYQREAKSLRMDWS